MKKVAFYYYRIIVNLHIQHSPSHDVCEHVPQTHLQTLIAIG